MTFFEKYPQGGPLGLKIFDEVPQVTGDVPWEVKNQGKPMVGGSNVVI